MSTSPMSTSPRSTFAGVFVLALSIILFEIALTRVFAIMMWHHFTYMVVSVGLLGFGAAGSLLTARRDSMRRESPVGALSSLSLKYGLSVIAAFFVITSLRVDSLDMWRFENMLLFAVLLLMVAVPFLFGGMAIGMALTRFSRDVNKLYFFDLVGSAVGAVASVYLLGSFSGTTTVMFASLFGFVAALLFALSGQASAATRRNALIATVGGALWTAAFAGLLSPLGIPTLEWRIPLAPQKEIRVIQEALLEGQPVDRIFSATAEVEVTAPFESKPTMGGDFGYRAPTIELRFVGQDGTAPTALCKDAGQIENFDFLRDGQAATSYRAFEASGRKQPKVLAIGVGGGIDVMVALVHDAQKVTAVEINTAMIRMVREDYADYIGDLLTPGAHPYSDRIDLVNSEGRSHLRHNDETYDIVQMSGVDSFTALNTGAYALSESYLYTTDAVREFYGKLNDNGYINYSRFFRARIEVDGPTKARETLRLANIAYTALEQLGVENAGTHLAVFRGDTWASTIIKRGPFTRPEIEALRALAREQGYVGLVYDPLLDLDDPFETALQVAQLSRGGLVGALAGGAMKGRESAQIERVVDHVLDAWAARVEGDEQAFAAAEASARAVAGKSDLDVAVWQTAGLEGQNNLFAGRLAQLAEAQRDFRTLLRVDEPTRRAFVDEYTYDITPCTDDKPFFFNYYRWSALLEREQRSGALVDPYHPTFPVGQLVLFVSMAQILLLAFVLILLPIGRLALAGVRTRGAWRYFCYFSALGLGFMFLEIPMMQKMMLFLGHPTYALSVVLATILGFAGLGSFAASRMNLLDPRNFRSLTIAVVVAILLSALAARLLLPMLLGFALETRIAIAVAMLAPMAFVLGMPFPTGIRLLGRRCPQLMPWGWAINGFLSVFASIFCVALSMVVGFTSVFVLAAVVYLLGFLAVRSEVLAAANGDVVDRGETEDEAEKVGEPAAV